MTKKQEPTKKYHKGSLFWPLDVRIQQIGPQFRILRKEIPLGLDSEVWNRMSSPRNLKQKKALVVFLSHHRVNNRR